MGWLRFCTFLLLSVAIKACPDGCDCQDQEVACDSLSATEISQLITSLNSSPFNATESLQIATTSNFSINELPSLKFLRTLIIDECECSDEWKMERGKFPNVTTLIFTNSKLTTFSRFLMTAFPKLQILNLSHNALTTLGFDSIHLARLEQLILTNNQIESLGVHILRYMPNLKTLDLSENRLFRLVTSDFYSASSLRYLKLSKNKIRVIESDTSTQLPQIEELDLSYNVLREVPGDGIQNMEELRFLNISHNPIEVVSEASLRKRSLEILDISHCKLKVVEAGAFTYLPYLHTLYLNDNPELISFSPYAARNISAFFSLDIRNTGFYRIPPSMLNHVSRIHVGNVRLDCACALSHMNEYETITIMDWAEATCATKTGAVHKLSELNKSLLSSKDQCRDRLLLPSGDEQEAVIGDSYRIHCSNDNIDSKMYWKTPSQQLETADSPEITSQFHKLDYFTSSLFDPTSSINRQNRTHPTTEYYGIDAVLQSDAGVYECISKQDQTTSRKIKLKVIVPEITLNASHVGVTSVHLTWNKNLHIRAVDRVALQVTAESGTEFKRQVQLSLYNMYCSYNVINLSPDREYLICLQWVITDSNSIIYSTCVTQKTKSVKSFVESVGIEWLLIGGIIILALGCFCCGNCLLQRFNFLTTAKRDSKMQQSVSGQSMLSNSISTSADATTYENFQLNTSPSFRDPII